VQIERYDSEHRYRYVAWDDFGSRIIGTAVVERRAGELVLDRISVTRVSRGNGVGTTMLTRILGDFIGEDIVVYSFRSRVGWYLRHGFEPEGRHGSLVKMRRRSRE